MKPIYFLMSILAFLAGCSPASSDKAPESFGPSSPKGLAIGTLTFEEDKPMNDIYRFFYAPASGDKKFKKRNAGKIMVKAREDNVSGFNGDFNDKRTYLFVIEREPGSYAFTQYNYLNHIGPSGMVSSSDKFSIPFDIKSGEITYIGELIYYDKAQKDEPRIRVSGHYARDLAEFKRKFPNIDWDSARDKTIKAGDTGGGIVVFE